MGASVGNDRYKNGNARRKLRKTLMHQVSHCPHCGVLLDWKHPYLPNSAELDEKWPQSKTPREYRARMAVDPDNVQVLCRKCNKLKGAYTPQQLAILEQGGRVQAGPMPTSRDWSRWMAT